MHRLMLRCVAIHVRDGGQNKKNTISVKAAVQDDKDALAKIIFSFFYNSNGFTFIF